MFPRKSNIVGSRIATERNAAGLTQEQLAEKMHVTRQTISNWEAGKSLPDIESLKKLADVLSIPIERLIYEQGKKIVPREPNEWGVVEPEEYTLRRGCRHLAIAVYVIGLLSGIQAGNYGSSFFLPDAIPVWWEALIRGTILLALSEILKHFVT